MTFEAFNRQIVIYRKNHPKPSAAKCTIVTDGTYLYLADHNGNKLGAQISCTIVEAVNSPPRAIVELFINIQDGIKTIPK